MANYPANYADARVEALAEQVQQNKATEPLDATLIAEELYFLTHESSRQADILELVRTLFDRTVQAEARAEIGYLLTQIYRQIGQVDAVADLVPSLGYIPEWRILGPVDAGHNQAIKSILEAKQTDGLHRQVSWQTVKSWDDESYTSSGLGHYGYFNANHAVYPYQLAGAYFNTAFHLDEKQTIRLGLGFSHRIRVWIDRFEVTDQLEKQESHPDQLVIHAQVKKGWHALTIYRETDNDATNLGFFARLTDAENQPPQFDSTRGHKTSRSKPSHVDVGMSELVLQAQAQSQAALGSLMLIKEFNQHSILGNPRDHLLAAFDNKPDQRIAEKLLSLTPNPNDRVALINRFLAQQPNSAWGLTQLGQIALSQERYWEARLYAQRAREADPQYWPAEILHTNTLANLRLVGEALRRTEDLSKRYPDVPWIMMDLCDLYWSMDFDQESEALLDRIMKIRRGQAKYTERKMILLKNKGDSAALDKLYQQLLLDAPYSMSIAIEYANLLAANRRFDKAESMLLHYLKQTPENPYILQALGECKLRRGDAEAVDLLKKALALRPQNPPLERVVTALEQTQSDFYAAYRVEKSPETDVLERSSIVLNIDNRVVKLAPNGQSSEYHQLEYEIMTEAGTTELPGYSFSYAPLRQTAKLISAVLTRGDERTLLTNVGRARVSEPEYRMYYDLVAFQVAFPALQVGDRIQLEYRIDHHDATNIFGDYFGDLVYFASSYPTRRVDYRLMVPKGRQIYHKSENMNAKYDVEERDEFTVHHWNLNQSPPYEMEARMPGIATYMPYVSISTFSDWQAMSKWYSELIKGQLQLDRASKQLAKDIVGDTTDHLEIVKKVHEYVVTNTRYVALEFGIHGYKPYPVTQVCSRQFGDCKDKASLLIALLREVGVEASIAIVRTYDKGDIHTFPASLSYFNHAIAYVPEFDMYLDGTAEFSGINELPDMDQGALTLVVDEQGRGKLSHIPFNDNNRRQYSFDVQLDQGGKAQISGELTYIGSQGPPIRQYLSIESKLDRNIQDLLTASFPGLKVQSASRQDSNLQESIQLSFAGESQSLAQQDGTGYRLPLKMLNDSLTQAFTPNSRRMFPVEMGVPREQTIRVQIGTPEEFEIADLPDQLKLEDDNVSVAITFDQTQPHQITVNYSLRFKKQRIEPNEYDAIRTLFLAHDQTLNQSIRWSNP